MRYMYDTYLLTYFLPARRTQCVSAVYAVSDGPLTRFSRSRHFWSRISQKRCISGTKFYRTLIGNHSQSIEWYHFQRSWVTSDPDFKVTTFLESNIGKMARLKDKVTMYTCRKPNLTYGMVLCFGQGSCAGLGFKASLEKFLNFRKLKKSLNINTKPYHTIPNLELFWKKSERPWKVWNLSISLCELPAIKPVEELLRPFYW